MVFIKFRVAMQRNCQGSTTVREAEKMTAPLGESVQNKGTFKRGDDQDGGCLKNLKGLSSYKGISTSPPFLSLVLGE